MTEQMINQFKEVAWFLFVEMTPGFIAIMVWILLIAGIIWGVVWGVSKIRE